MPPCEIDCELGETDKEKLAVVSITIFLFAPSDPVVPGAASVRLALFKAASLIVPPFSVRAFVDVSSRSGLFCPAPTV